MPMKERQHRTARSPDRASIHCPMIAKEKARKTPGPDVTFDHLPAQPQPKLELARIKRGRRRARHQIERVHVRHVEAVNQVEHINHPFQPHAFAELDGFSHTHVCKDGHRPDPGVDRKSTRLNSSHMSISYAAFCLKKNSYSNHPSI